MPRPAKRTWSSPVNSLRQLAIWGLAEGCHRFRDVAVPKPEPQRHVAARRTPPLEIVCGGPTRVAFTVHENRPDSAITHQEASAAGMPWPYQNPVNGAPHAWGLGRIDDVKIGAVVLLVRPQATVVDGVPPFLSTSMVLSRPSGAPSWPVQSAVDTINLNPTDEYSFGKDASVMPITTASVSLAVIPVLNRTAALPTSKEIPLDGSVTFTLRYL